MKEKLQENKLKKNISMQYLFEVDPFFQAPGVHSDVQINSDAGQLELQVFLDKVAPTLVSSGQSGDQLGTQQLNLFSAAGKLITPEVTAQPFEKVLPHLDAESFDFNFGLLPSEQYLTVPTTQFIEEVPVQPNLQSFDVNQLIIPGLADQPIHNALIQPLQQAIALALASVQKVITSPEDSVIDLTYEYDEIDQILFQQDKEIAKGKPKFKEEDAKEVDKAKKVKLKEVNRTNKEDVKVSYQTKKKGKDQKEKRKEKDQEREEKDREREEKKKAQRAEAQKKELEKFLAKFKKQEEERVRLHERLTELKEKMEDDGKENKK